MPPVRFGAFLTMHPPEEQLAIARRVDEHRGAGADHVCIQVLSEDRRALPMAQWRALADALLTRA